MNEEEPRPIGEESRVIQLLEERKFAEALHVLDQLEPTATTHSLSGVAYFLDTGQYEVAAQCFRMALELEPDDTDWQQMLELSEANAKSKVNIYVPDKCFFKKNSLAHLTISNTECPAITLGRRRTGVAKRLAVGLGNLFGIVSSVAMGSATSLWGSVFGYRGRIWTNWYKRPYPLGILTLAYMREKLNKNNLKNTYRPGTRVGCDDGTTEPPPGAKYFRTANGTWNNLKNPREGAAGTRFMRNVANSVIPNEQVCEETLRTPDPRIISRELLTRKGEMKTIPSLNLIAASWIQFQNHDWVNHGEVSDDEVELPLSPDDPLRKRFHQTEFRVGKTQRDVTACEGTPIMTFINEVTHWWDGSQIYGSDIETVQRLRGNADGKLRLDNGLLPLTNGGMEDTGFVRNWWLGLSMLHTLFAREHNAICDHLKTFYPHWDHVRLFNVARLINAAVMAKIHTVEWTPAILPNRALDRALNANWFGIATNLWREGKDRKTRAAVNIQNPEMGGVVGNTINKHGAPYGLSEEFVEVYRLHSLLPEFVNFKSIQGDCEKVIPLPATRQAASATLTREIPMHDLFYSFGNQHPGKLVLNNYPRFMQQMSVPGNALVDLAAVDILRARERGVPRYNNFRRQLGLNPIGSFDDLTDDRSQVAAIKKIYGDQPRDVEKLDLLIGTLSEGHRPTGFGFGETIFQIFILNATRRLQADRFYTDSYNEDTYTAEGLHWIDQTDLKAVLLRHYPELSRTGLANVTNAFEPWDEGRKLDRDRHPLRAFDPRTKDNPCIGDRYRP